MAEGFWTIYAYNSLLGVYLFQGYGKCLWKAHGFFKANGGCGYIHKPKFLLENDANGAIFNPKLHHAVKEIFKVNYNLLHLCLKLVEIRKVCGLYILGLVWQICKYKFPENPHIWQPDLVVSGMILMKKLYKGLDSHV